MRYNVYSSPSTEELIVLGLQQAKAVVDDKAVGAAVVALRIAIAEVEHLRVVGT